MMLLASREDCCEACPDENGDDAELCCVGHGGRVGHKSPFVCILLLWLRTLIGYVDAKSAIRAEFSAIFLCSTFYVVDATKSCLSLTLKLDGSRFLSVLPG